MTASKPRGSRKPGYDGKGCRRLRPEEQRIPIAVPPLVGREVWDRARAQLARNAALSFRNTTRRDYLLRCLLACGGCGLAMHGATWPTPGGERRYYRCGAGTASGPVGRSPARGPAWAARPWSGRCGATSASCSPTPTG